MRSTVELLVFSISNEHGRRDGFPTKLISKQNEVECFYFSSASFIHRSLVPYRTASLPPCIWIPDTPNRSPARNGDYLIRQLPFRLLHNSYDITGSSLSSNSGSPRGKHVLPNSSITLGRASRVNNCNRREVCCVDKDRVMSFGGSQGRRDYYRPSSGHMACIV